MKDLSDAYRDRHLHDTGFRRRHRSGSHCSIWLIGVAGKFVTQTNASMPSTRSERRMRESRTYGSVCGGRPKGNSPYHDRPEYAANPFGNIIITRLEVRSFHRQTWRLRVATSRVHGGAWCLQRLMARTTRDRAGLWTNWSGRRTFVFLHPPPRSRSGGCRGSDPGVPARLLEGKDLASVDPAKGKFRSFLLASLKHFLANEWDRQRAKKRGGGRRLLSIDTHDAEDRYRTEPVDNVTPELLFTRHWALTLLDNVLTRLRQEYKARSKEPLFEGLKKALTGELDAPGSRNWPHN